MLPGRGKPSKRFETGVSQEYQYYWRDGCAVQHHSVLSRGSGHPQGCLIGNCRNAPDPRVDSPRLSRCFRDSSGPAYVMQEEGSFDEIDGVPATIARVALSRSPSQPDPPIAFLHGHLRPFALASLVLFLPRFSGFKLTLPSSHTYTTEHTCTRMYRLPIDPTRCSCGKGGIPRRELSSAHEDCEATRENLRYCQCCQSHRRVIVEQRVRRASSSSFYPA